MALRNLSESLTRPCFQNKQQFHVAFFFQTTQNFRLVKRFVEGILQQSTSTRRPMDLFLPPLFPVSLSLSALLRQGQARGARRVDTRHEIQRKRVSGCSIALHSHLPSMAKTASLASRAFNDGSSALPSLISLAPFIAPVFFVSLPLSLSGIWELAR